MKKAIYPGSFDPITTGHIDMIQRAAKQFDEVVVLVTESREKQYLFTAEERMDLIKQSVSKIPNVSVATYQGLTINYVKSVGAQVILRGLRAVVDFEYEMTMASMNRKLNPEIETLLLFSSPEAYFISSRAVKEVAKYNGELGGLVPPHVAQPLLEKLKAKAAK